MMRLFSIAVGLMLFAFGTAAGQSRYLVHQQGKKFEPARLTVQQGDTVLFQNDDAVVHNVFSETPGFEFNLKRQAPGSSGVVRLGRAGVAEVRCAIHPGMKFAVTVR